MKKLSFIPTLFCLVMLVHSFSAGQEAFYQQRFSDEERMIEQNKFYQTRQLPSNNLIFNSNRLLKHAETLDAVVPDFQVNENVGYSSQSNPATGSNKNGNIVVVWQDRRNGLNFVYAQRFLNNTPVGNNFQLDDYGNWGDGTYPSVALDSDGNFVVVWNDHRDLSDIYCRTFQSDGTPNGNSFIVNDNDDDSYPSGPKVAMNKDGSFIVVWDESELDIINGYSNIFAQRFNANGTPLDNNFRVNDITEIETYSPSIASDENGNFIVSWKDRRNDSGDIYAQRYSSDGTALDVNFKVNDDAGTEYQGNPSVVCDSTGNFIIVWEDDRTKSGDLYAQLYNNLGISQNNNFFVGEGYNGVTPVVEMFENDDFIISWWNGTQWDYDLYGRLYNSDGSAKGDIFNIENINGKWMQGISIGIKENDGFMSFWGQDQNNNSNIYVQECNSTGSTVGDDYMVNDDPEGSSWQEGSKIAVDSDGNFTIVWNDYREGDWWNIYARRFSIDGSPQGNDFKVNTTDTEHFKLNPDIACSNDGRSIIVWEDWHDYSGHFQLYDNNGSAIGDNEVFNDNNLRVFGAQVAMNDSGYFVIVWYGGNPLDYDSYGTYFQCFDPQANVMNNSTALIEPTNNEGWDSEVAIDKNGNFVITFQETRNTDADIYAKRYSKGGTPLDNDFQVNINMSNGGQTEPEIIMDDNGNFTIAWVDRFDDNNRKICAQQFASDGSFISNNFEVCNIENWYFEMAQDENGDITIVWPENREIMGLRFHSNWTQHLDVFRINTVSDNYQDDPDVCMWNGHIYTTWTDNNPLGTGFNVWANVLDWQSATTGIVDVSDLMPSEFSLSQNFPNPFNPVTQIEYSLPQDEYVQLILYDVQGRKVKTLVSEIKSAGTYKAELNGSDLSSGIYFYRIITEHFTEQKKVLLLK